MLHYFHQVEVTPSNQSELGKAMPEVSGAFVNCLVRASSEAEALSKLRDSLQIDGYTYLHNERVEAIDGTVGQQLPELDHMLGVLEDQGGNVVYGDFHCYE